jgi:hypothetical protein
LDHLIILDEQHLRSVLAEFVHYYNLDRPVGPGRQAQPQAGASKCDPRIDGLKPIRQLIDQAGLSSNDIVLVDRQGGDPAPVTPEQMVC